MRVLAFSASPRKVWIEDFRKVLNPSYWLLAKLIENLAEDETVYVIPQSMTPVGKLIPYNGEPVDKIVVMGVGYSPAALATSFKKGYIRHENAFKIGEVTKQAYDKYRPEVVELAVDVRRWYQDVTDCFGFKPDRVITEQEMLWQQVGFYYVRTQVPKSFFQQKRVREFAFSGHAKRRFVKMKMYMANLPMPGTVDGGGWEDHLSRYSHISLRGTQPYYSSVEMMLSKQYGLTLHEPLGEKAGWITAKFYENLGCNLINFTDVDYDRHELVLPKKSTLRVETGRELEEKMKKYTYMSWLQYQSKLIDENWLDWTGWYYRPFRERLQSPR